MPDPKPIAHGIKSVFVQRNDGSFIPRSTIEHLRSKIEKNLNINRGSTEVRYPFRKDQQLPKSKSHGTLQAPIQVD